MRHQPPATYFMGLDLGQVHDPTALAIVEHNIILGERDRVTYEFSQTPVLDLRYLNRIPLGTPYPDIVDHVVDVTNAPGLGEANRYLAVDQTGVGRPVVDMLRDSRIRGPLYPVTITGGGTENYTNGEYRVPKRDLISRLQVLLQSNTLRIAPNLADTPTLLREMSAMRVQIGAKTEEYASWREREHDDLIFAVALACWAANKHFPAKSPYGRPQAPCGYLPF